MQPDPDLYAEPQDRHPCERLWLAALNQMFMDAACYRRGVSALAGDALDAEAAHLELLHCGPHLRYVCSFLDYEPREVTEAYRRWIGELVAA